MPITLTDVGFEWPNGTGVFTHLNLTLEPKKVYGLVGANGAGKTTLARLITNELEPTHGWVKSTLTTYYFKQSEPQPKDSTLSGGEWTKARLQLAIQSSPELLILDEPTNHLDRSGREAIHDFIKHSKRGILIISHDRELLNLCDEILELTAKGLKRFGGNFEFYWQERERERERLLQNLEKAKDKRDQAKLKRQEKLDRQAKRQRKGKEAALRGGMPKILLGARKRQAQKTMAKIDTSTQSTLHQAVTDAFEAYEDLKVDPVMFAKLPQPDIPHGKLLLEAQDFNFSYGDKWLFKENLNFSFRGPARIAIQGPNGSGKSTLLNLLTGKTFSGKSVGTLKLGNITFAVLDQNYSLLNFERLVFENVRESCALEESELRNLLAMFLFRGSSADQIVGTLSGGEKLRCGLAKVLLSKPVPQLLILDEPTNNLDLANIEFFEKVLGKYKGGLLVVSHDRRFIGNLNLDSNVKCDEVVSGFKKATEEEISGTKNNSK